MSLRKCIALAASLFTFAFGAYAQGQQQQPYAVLSPPQPTEAGGKIEVVEFFWYGCPHCYHLEPEVNAWLKTIPPDVVFKRVHAIPNQAWAAHASIYYTLESMGLVDRLHSKVFDAIHKDNLNLTNPKIRDEWLAKNGVDPAKYNEMAKSFSVNSKLQRASQLTMAYKVDGVPRIFVNGKYYTAPEFAGPDRTFAVVNDLIAVARKENAASATSAAGKK
jgi:protein dithiol oxidoreductase (disulfide-forming)